MSNATDNSVLSPSDLDRFVKSAGENDNIDAKRPMKWDGGVHSARLAKDIAAFGNSRDGGVLVIGKSEQQDGSFKLEGLSDEQSKSFDTTKVANWVNSRFRPAIRLTCHSHKYDGKTFVVITVREFDDVPAVCTRSYDDPENSKRQLLRAGSIYVRGANAESKPAESVDEWRTIIGLATKKRRDEFLSYFNAMLKGRPLVQTPTDGELFEAERERVCADLGLSTPEAQSRGAWAMWFHPASFSPERWTDDETLEDLIRQHCVRLYDPFPAYKRDTKSMGWGIANDFYEETWAITRSGLFLFHKEFDENSVQCSDPGYRGGAEARAPLRAGEWIAYQWSIRTFVNFFRFMARFTEAYDGEESVYYELTSGPLSGRKLASARPHDPIGIGKPEPCRAKEFHDRRTLAIAEIRTNWEDLCARAMKEFFQLFPGHRISVETLRGWVEKYKHR